MGVAIRRFALGTSLLAMMFIALSVGGGAASKPTEAESGWEIECVNCPPYFDKMTPRSAAMDDAGYIHIAYGGDHLYYAVGQPGGPWEIETVDPSPNVGLYAALALDSTGMAHIVYYDAENGFLKYACQDGGGWTVESLTFLVAEEPHYAMVFDLQDRLLMSFYQETSADLYFVVRQDSVTWQLTQLDEVGDVGQYNSIALDNAGNPHISYHDATNEGLNYAFHDGIAWQIVQFSNIEGTANTSIAIDSSGYAHIAFKKDFPLMYLYADASGWHEELIDDLNPDPFYTLDIGLDVSIALDHTDRAHVSYSSSIQSSTPYPDYIYYDVRYAYRDTAGWSSELVENDWGLVFSRRGSLILDQDEPYIIFRSASWYNSAEDFSTLTLADRVGESWSFERIDRSEDLGLYSDILMDKLGRPQVSYFNIWYDQFTFDQTSLRTVNHSVRSTVGWMHSPDLEWELGHDYTSALFVDWDNYPYIVTSYFNRYPRLNMTYFDGLNWHNQLGPGTDVDMAAGADGIMHAAVGHIYPYDLAYRCWNGEWSEPEQVDSGSAHGTSITLDVTEKPHIAYATRDPKEELRYAVRTPSSWLTETLAFGRFSHVSIDIIPGGQLIISAYEMDNNVIYVVKQEDGVWQVNQIDWYDGIGEPSDMVIDNLGRIHISYYIATTRDLAYALYTDRWHHTIVDSEGDVGSHSALALGRLNSRMIVYYDATLRDVKLATLPTEVVGVSHLPLILQP